ncbi:MAG: aspartate aminotransferase family protein [Elusimicrobia bacterium]|nr:aspartate aminotransferase family protein [Elusimicrobiota bacterium]
MQKAEKKHLIQTYDRYQIALSHGRGAYLYGPGGKRYLDFVTGIGVMALGYAHPAVTRVLREQSTRLVHTSNLFYTPFQSLLAKRLAALSGLDRAFFCNSGSEAIEAAFKFSRAFARAEHQRGRVRFLALENAFHGRTMGAVAATFTAKYREPFAPTMPGVSFVRFDDVADLRRKFDAKVCAVCVEPVQGEGGIRPVSRGFLREARRLTRKTGALLICDEIQCGLGRTGRMFAFQHSGIKPDLVTLAKPLAAGLPLGAVLATNRVARAITPGMHGTTFGGGPLACAVALEVLAVLERDRLLARARELGSYFLSRLQALAAKHDAVKEARGLGLMLALELKDEGVAKTVQKRLLARGIIINRTHGTTLRLLPPYIIRRGQIDEVVAALDEAL